MDKKVAIFILEGKVIQHGVRDGDEYKLKYQPDSAVELCIIYNREYERLCIKCKIITAGTVEINLKTNTVTVLHTEIIEKYSFFSGYHSETNKVKMCGKFDTITKKFMCTMCNANKRSTLQYMLEIALGGFALAVRDFGLSLGDFDIDCNIV